MGLADYKKATHVISLNDDCEVAVSGLSLSDITGLIRNRYQQLEEIYDTAVGPDNQIDVEQLLQTASDVAPEIITDIIVLGSGEVSEEVYAAASNLPGPLQLSIVAKVIELTFTEVGGVKKFVETVKNLLPKKKVK